MDSLYNKCNKCGNNQGIDKTPYKTKIVQCKSCRTVGCETYKMEYISSPGFTNLICMEKECVRGCFNCGCNIYNVRVVAEIDGGIPDIIYSRIKQAKINRKCDQNYSMEEANRYINYGF